MIRWQWYQLDHVQIICTSLQANDHATTSQYDNYNKLFTII